MMHFLENRNQDRNQEIPTCFILESISVFRKFTFFFDIITTSMQKGYHEKEHLFMMCGFQDYLIARKAMFAHSSQLVWFRHLYISFSRYMLMNDLRKVSGNMKNIKKVQ